MSNTIKFVEVYNRSGNGTIRDYGLRTIYLNPDHIVCLVEDTRYAGLLSEGSLPKDLDQRRNCDCGGTDSRYTRAPIQH